MKKSDNYERYEPQGEIADAVTGELFDAKARNHYEENDGVPFAPPVDFPRPSLRHRIENLTNRNIDPWRYYTGSDGYEMDVPEDGDEPLTPSETQYLDMVASDLAEAAPLPDEGMPRTQELPPVSPVPQNAPAAAPGPVAGVPSAPAPAQAPLPPQPKSA